MTSTRKILRVSVHDRPHPTLAIRSRGSRTCVHCNLRSTRFTPVPLSSWWWATGSTALHWAAFKGHKEIITDLLAFGGERAPIFFLLLPRTATRGTLLLSGPARCQLVARHLCSWGGLFLLGGSRPAHTGTCASLLRCRTSLALRKEHRGSDIGTSPGFRSLRQPTIRS